MRLLILGGGVFVGRTISAAALARGHAVTHLNRGNSAVPPGVERLVADRRGDLAVLAGREWDAVIDTCGYVPKVVRNSVQALAGRVRNYVFISSVSAYANFRKAGMDESAPLGVTGALDADDITSETYGPLKAACEAVVREGFPDGALIIRPGLVVGPHDPTDRFTYWPMRVARGGTVLAPDTPNRTLQFIDARDLAAWTVAMVERRATGIFNATGLPGALTMGELLDACRAASKSAAAVEWVPGEFLSAQSVKEWSEMPLWIAPASMELAAFARVSVSRALAAGLRVRRIEETVADTLAWAQSRPPGHEWKAGLTAEREAELLALWRAQANVAHVE